MNTVFGVLLIFDNFYSIRKIVLQLTNRNIGCIATLRSNRVGCKEIIDKKISNHWSRHTITSISKSLGVDLYELKNWLGHTSVKTTENYVNTITTHSSVRNSTKVKNLLENPNSLL